MAETKRRAAICRKRVCGIVIEDWQLEVVNQRRLKLAAVERWILTCRLKIQLPFRKWYLWVADSMAKQHAQGLIADMMRRRWIKSRLERLLQAWHNETESGAEHGRGREELLSLLNEQRQMNTALEESVGRYKELHNKTELGLRRHEDLLSKREKQMIKIERERTELSMRMLSAEQALLSQKSAF
jgi:hypothetical protein